MLKRLSYLFWSKVEILGLDECWEWTAKISPSGYGIFRTGDNYGISRLSHRVAYYLSRGILLPDIIICHRCDNKRCCNPSHLFSGTHQENMDDMVTKSRQARGSTHGMSRLSDEEVRRIREDNRSQKAIALDYGISRSQVSHIKTLKSWRHIC